MKKSSNKGLGKRLFDFFASIKLSVVVLIALAATSVFGTVIQQHEKFAVYVAEYGEGVARVIRVLGLDDMYHSWWFQLLLVLLLVNITFCSLKRLPHAVRLMNYRDPVFDGKPVAIHEKWTKRVKGADVAAVADAIEGLLRRRLRRVYREERDGAVYLLGTRGGWSRMGVYVTHFSLFLFGIGALVGALWGFKGFVNIPEGQSVSQVRLRGGGVKDLGFEVRCDDFQVTFYTDRQGRSTGRPRDYISDLTVLENGREVLRKRIEVNDPLIYKGIYFYQSSYGQAGGRAAWLTVFGPRRNILFHRRKVARGASVDLENGDRLVLRELTGDFRGMGPAVEVVLQPAEGKPQTTVVFQAPEGNHRKLGGYVIRLDGVETVMYTGLQVAKDPGVPIIWAGCILITLGLMIAFFLSHRRVWARVRPADRGGVEVFLGGNASRNRIAFERWFADLCTEAQEVFEK
ncbi:cytochrome c biogenesis protein ResB [Deferrisoma camini]|uniref:cytochrome c biogenesis protein ResB n=1 Tax=Deferrisoma camini TaxID=1035120 RepID=UPI00046CBC70|nr:cytochrome c biogenesis protein ResB [Deferrisoma camini]